MTIFNVLRPYLGILFGLTVLSVVGLVIVFMVTAMAGGLESREKIDLGINDSTSPADAKSESLEYFEASTPYPSP